MDALFTAIGTVITNMISNLSTISTALISNVIFQIMIGIAMLFILIGIVFKLVHFLQKFKF